MPPANIGLSEEEDTMNNMGRNIIIWLVFGAALLALFNLFQSPSSTSPEASSPIPTSSPKSRASRLWRS